MISILSHKCKLENIQKKHPNVIILDITSKASKELVRLSPFYPYGDIPVPFSDGILASCVEAVWQGLKVFEDEGIDTSTFNNNTMDGIKRTTRKHGKIIGHQKGVNNVSILNYQTAKHLIYIPTYKWMIEHKCLDLIAGLRKLARNNDIVLLDYNTCIDVDNTKKPLSHAFLVKAYVEKIYPYEDAISEITEKDQIDLKNITLILINN
jgi:hypothetical protein